MVFVAHLIVIVFKNWDELSLLCLKCLGKIDRMCKFREMCLRSEAVRKRLLNGGVRLEVHIEDVACTDEKCESSQHLDDSIEIKEEPVLLATPNAVKNERNEQATIHVQKAKKHVCEICHEEFHAKWPLLRHRCKSDFVCDACGKRLKTIDTFQQHVLKAHQHPSKLKYICGHCNKRFAFKSQLSAHFIRHTDKEHMSCGTCGKKFCNKYSLERHRVKVHAKLGRIRCDLCLNTFTNLFVLKRHKKRVHDGATAMFEDFECFVCKQQFGSAEQLKIHGGTHGREKPFMCSLLNEPMEAI